ncbi:uncharacterized protein [Triticum aestivum]|uniref:uncharacterized protein n=1 Tax=Triticum aestivum TaxID=4565 RepID=UPI001D013785|nr:uncharacterized protein LOC123090524 [Triticum aestivum]
MAQPTTAFSPFLCSSVQTRDRGHGVARIHPHHGHCRRHVGHPAALLVYKNVVGPLANPSAHFPLSIARFSSPTRTRRCRRHGQPSLRVPRRPRRQGACSKALSASAASITRFGLSRAPSHRGDRAHLQPPFAAVRRVDPHVPDSPRPRRASIKLRYPETAADAPVIDYVDDDSPSCLSNQMVDPWSQMPPPMDAAT